MNLSPIAQATMLLTSHFSPAASAGVKPLTNREWGKFAVWLNQHDAKPDHLLSAEADRLLKQWDDAKITTDRILQLLGRGHSLALALEKWQRAGLWVVTRSEPEYPRRLKHRLKNQSPPVLFGCGNKALLNAGGLAVVGSRDAGEADLLFAENVGAKAAAESVSIVSGGARGVDETAMLGALNNGGSAVGILADSLLKAATGAKWRTALMQNQVVLLSPFYPEAGFSVGHAMARNKYIYCLSEAALVVHSGEKGGTVSGAKENLNKAWVPMWVKPTEDNEAANAELVASGGSWCAAEVADLSVSALFTSGSITPNATGSPLTLGENADLFSAPIQPETRVAEEEVPPQPTGESDQGQTVESVQVTDADMPSELKRQLGETKIAHSFYRKFTQELVAIAKEPVTLDALLEHTGVHESQANVWLQQAVDEGVLLKFNGPVRYQAIEK